MARAGVDVCLLDRNAFPRDKICGDLLGGEAIAELRVIGIEPGSLPAEVAASVARYRAVSVEGTEQEGALNLSTGPEQGAYVIRRADLDNILRRAALSAGAQWLSPYRCMKIEQNAVGGFTLNGEASGVEARIDSDAVIVAAGASSRFSPALATGDEVFLAGRAYYAEVAISPRISEFYYLDHLPLHYAWVFPLPCGIFNVGIIMSRDRFREQRRRLGLALDKVITSIPDARRALGNAHRVSSFQTTVLRAGLRGNHLTREGLLFVGDAAGVANPFNGEGIGPAMVSGRLAAEAIASAIHHRGASRTNAADNYSTAISARYESAYRSAHSISKAREALIRIVSAHCSGAI
jgi:flavin-dependent dehydrogenase